MAHTGGDTNTNSVLDDGETWTFTCSRTFPGGVFTNHASLSGSSNRDGRPWPETIAESRSESAWPRSWDTAISSPSEETPITSTTPAVLVAKRFSSQLKSAAALFTSVTGSTAPDCGPPVHIITCSSLPGMGICRSRVYGSRICGP